jgi:hypothetical protein
MRRKTLSRRWYRCSGGSRQWCHALLDEIAPSRASRASSSSRNFRTTWRPKRNRLVDDRSRKNKIGDVSRRSLESSDGHGNLSASSTVDFAGFITPVTFTGTYTVNANCSGNLTVDAGSSGIVHRDLVIVDADKEVEFVSTDPGVVIAGYMKKQRIGGE